MKTFCVIGAGPAGLCAVKNCLASGFEVVAFEKGNQVGGTWVYTEDVGKDRYGVDVHSSLYQGLTTNLPKEIMVYPDFPYPSEDRSYVSAEKILEYFRLYADKFNLHDHIKLEHEVIRVRPLMNKKYEVIVRNLPANELKTFAFDFVLVCNGFSEPLMPKIDGHEALKAKKMHSHDYRKPANYEGEKVLVIGAGPSGIEITLAVGKTAKSVVWSNHAKKTFGRDLNIKFPENTKIKVDVREFSENGAHFEDGSFEEFTVVIYATGYDFTFPFLSVDCGLSVDGKHVKPLFKHCININQPTMAIIGLPFFGVGVPMYDLQIRFVLKFFSGDKKLPSKAEMLQDMQQDEEERKSKGFPKKKAHYLGLQEHEHYYEELSAIAEIERIKPVLPKIFNKTVMNIFTDFNTYRKMDFKIVDDESFEEIWLEKA